MRTYDDSTLWRISEYERHRTQTGTSGFMGLDTQTTLPHSLLDELNRLQSHRLETDVLEVFGACMRRLESALLLLRHEELLWPLTLFPQQRLYHLPRSIIEVLPVGSRDLQVISVEPPGLLPPDQASCQLVSNGPGFRPLKPLTWALALCAPGGRLLAGLRGRFAFRLSAEFEAAGAPAGAYGAALKRLRSEVASLHEIASWPGMSEERAARLLNGAYLQGALILLRTHPAARPSDTGIGRLKDWWRNRG